MHLAEMEYIYFVGLLIDLANEMDVYVTELASIQAQITTMSSGALSESIEIMGYVREIETAATGCDTISTASLEVRIADISELIVFMSYLLG